MKTNRKEQYVAPEISAVEIQSESVICSSVNASNPFEGATEEEL